MTAKLYSSRPRLPPLRNPHDTHGRRVVQRSDILASAIELPSKQSFVDIGYWSCVPYLLTRVGIYLNRPWMVSMNDAKVVEEVVWPVVASGQP